ncbi:response regulator transcription factor [Streptomyces sp. NPDC048581]|jgi:DNA-binding NarL/FixJ family response regulator|uniref:response regulator transcription factor n=1 Tax=unclassified Streptomyces TaxID=2593676 RepID=UPI00371869E5
MSLRKSLIVRPTSEGVSTDRDLRNGESGEGVGQTAPVLTPRERQVLDGIKEGYSNRMVGRVLGISERTVKVHLHSIFIKLGANSRTEAVIAGIRNGSISLH